MASISHYYKSLKSPDDVYDFAFYIDDLVALMDADLLGSAFQIFNKLLNKKEDAQYLLWALERARETFNRKKNEYPPDKCSKTEETLNKMKKIAETHLKEKSVIAKKGPCSLKRLLRYK